MIAIEISSGIAGKALTARIIEEARERGVLLMQAGSGNVIRVLVPLVIDDRQLEVGLARIAQSFETVFGKPEVKENS